MNVYDSARMADVIGPLGYEPAASPAEADIVILNTCHIREKASEKLFSELGRLREIKLARSKEGGDLILGVAGCVAQAEGEDILARAPHVDLVVGPQSYHVLPDLIARASRGEARLIATDFPPEPKFDFLPEERSSAGVSAFLTVQEGCDKFCTFCVVPYTRGAESSRPVASIMREARHILQSGAREITLLGQNVNAFHGEGPDGRVWGLGRLIRNLAELDGLERVRYTTSHPLDMDDELVLAHRDVPALMPFVHLPVQSGSDRILSAMNRRHTVDDYRRAVDRIRKMRADTAMSSDFIVGFPGETDRDFAATLSLVNEIGFAQAYSFKFSPRPGTPAAGLEDTEAVPDTVKNERLAALQQVLSAWEEAFNQSFVGRVVEVLFDRPGRRPGQMSGRSPHFQAVHVPGSEELMGSARPVLVEAAYAHSLSGTVADDGPGPDETAPILRPGACSGARGPA